LELNILILALVAVGVGLPVSFVALPGLIGAILQRDRAVVGYIPVYLDRGSFKLPSGYEDLFSEYNRSQVFRDFDSVLAENPQFIAEVLVYGEIMQIRKEYHSKDYRVLQVVANGGIKSRLFSWNRPKDGQRLLDDLQSREGRFESVRYGEDVRDFEPTVLTPTKRALKRRELAKRSDGVYWIFFAKDEPEIVPGLVEIPEEKTQRSIGRRRSELGSILDELKDRCSTNAGRQIYPALRRLAGEVAELEGKLQGKDVPHGAELLRVKYAPTLRKLVDLSSESYYGSFLTLPERWSDAQRMALQVELSTISIAKELTEDLRQLNSPSEFEFKLNVLSIIGDTEARGAESEGAAVGELLKVPAGGWADLQGDLDSFRAAVELERSALLQGAGRLKAA